VQSSFPGYRFAGRFKVLVVAKIAELNDWLLLEWEVTAPKGGGDYEAAAAAGLGKLRCKISVSDRGVQSCSYYIDGWIVAGYVASRKNNETEIRYLKASVQRSGDLRNLLRII
jgi:hypothetical protein